jgi:hypothetical protein
VSESAKTTTCKLCFQEHEVTSIFGFDYVLCPEMPKDLIIPESTLEAFMAGKSMLDQPLIVVR